ncbi:MAG: hypothetical protein AAFR78_08845, partial [Planctomycetota bacterium]
MVGTAVSRSNASAPACAISACPAEREGQPEDAWQQLEPLREHEDPGIRAEAARVALSAGHAEIAQAGAEALLRETAVPTMVH